MSRRCAKRSKMVRTCEMRETLYNSSDLSLLFLMFHSCCALLCSTAQSDLSAFTADVSVADSSVDREKTHNAELTECDRINNQYESYSELVHVSIETSGEKILTLVLSLFSAHDLCFVSVRLKTCPSLLIRHFRLKTPCLFTRPTWNTARSRPPSTLR